MIILQDKKLTLPETCHYLPEKKWVFEYFFAMNLEDKELENLLSTGWRKFGSYFFRPRCNGCNKCQPIRVLVDDFIPSKSMRRVAKKNRDVKVKFSSLNYSSEIFEIYKDHSENRFNQIVDEENFVDSFYVESCNTLQSEYYLNDKLIAVGFLDLSTVSLSSIYFIYKDEFKKLSLGVYSVLKEIEFAKLQKLRNYYLGYYIEDNHSMAYKGKYNPHEIYSWEKNRWDVLP